MGNAIAHGSKGEREMKNRIKLSAGASRRDGMKYIPFGDPDPERIIVSMIEFNDRIYVATQKGIYIIKDDELVRLKFKEKKNGMQKL